MDMFNAADFLVHRQVREGHATQLALSGTRTLTYGQLSAEVSRIAAGLRGLGLHRDDRVALLMTDDVEMAVTILAAFHAGLVAVPLSTMLTSHDLAEMLRDAGSRVVVTNPEFLDTVLPAIATADEVDRLVVTGAAMVKASSGLVRAGLSFSPWGDLDQEPIDPVDTEADAWALWLFTSGTTGAPKAAMHRHASIRHVYENYGRQILGVRADDRCLSVAKMFFAYGIGNSLFFPLAAGATSILQPLHATPQSMGELLVTKSPTLFFGVPTFYSSLLTSDLRDDAFATVRWCVSAGEPLPAALQQKVKSRFGVDILDGLGSTEALHIFLSNRPDDIRPGTSGKPVPGYSVEVRDSAGRLVPPGTPGELYVRGESLALGYWRRARASRMVFQGEWLHPGDTYVLDDDGYYLYLGRSSELLKPGGIWVSPAEVEARLLAHEGVAEAAVVGIPDADGIDKPAALVVRSPGHEQVCGEDLLAWCREGLAAFKRPRSVQFTTELPKTATGKVQHFRVKQQLLDLLAATTS